MSDHRSVALSVLFDGDHSPEFSADYYDKRARTYDYEVNSVQYKGPQIIADIVTQYVADKNATILCIGAGTGLEGVALHNQGFRRINVQDGSEQMIKLARQRGIFEECYCELLYHDRQSVFNTNSYDVMTCLGCITPGCLDARHLDELLRIVRVGGLTFTAIQQCFTRPMPEHNWPHDLEAKIQEMHNEGQIELIERREVREWGGIQEEEEHLGIVYVYRKK